MNWIALLIAGIIEIFGVYAMKRYSMTKNNTILLLLIGSFSISFLLLSYAMRSISMGTAYAIWTGIGTAGSTIVGILVFKESKDIRRIVFLCCILIGAIGLKMLH